MPDANIEIKELMDQAQRLMRQGAFAEAEELFQTLLANAPTAPDEMVALEGLALIALEKDDAAKAIELFEKVMASTPERADLHYNLANAYAATGRFDLAVEAYQGAVAREDGFVEAWFNLGEVLEKLDRLDDAIFAYERVISLMPDLAPAYGNLGCVLTETGRLDEAIQVLKRSIAIEPAFPPTHTNLGNAYKYAGDMDQSIAAHQEAIRLAPGYADARYNLGVTLSMAGQYESAVEMLSSAIELRPELSRAKVALGAAYIGLKEPDYALALCLEAPPEDCEMLALKPFALASSGRAGEAEAFADYGRFAGDRMLAAPPGYTDLDEFNNALVGHILAHPSLAHAPTSHATVNGKHTGNLLTEPIGPFVDFEAALWAAVDTYQSEIGEGDEHPFGNRRELGELVVWAIVMENGGHQVPHFHPTGWISGVYYPRLPDFHDGLGGSDAGWLEFGAPPPDIPFSGQTHIGKVEPKEGLLLFFPSFFYHRTIPFNAAEPRVSIAFDFRPAL